MPNSDNAKIKINPDVLLNISGSGWLTKIIIMNPAVTKTICFKTRLKSEFEAENKKNNPRIDNKNKLKNK